MGRFFSVLFILLFIICYKSNSQNKTTVDNWEEYLNDLSLEDINSDKLESLYDDLSFLSENPFDINEVTAEELNCLPFLSEQQIRDIITYRKRSGRFDTIYELKGVESMDYNTIQLILPFIYVGSNYVDKPEFSVNNLFKYGKNELVIRFDKCFQRKAGYFPYSDSILALYPNRRYLGESFYHSVRYSYTFDDRLQAGIVMEKDAGEPFANRYHKGYDFYTAHVLLKDLNHWLKCLVVGDYKISFGQGLVISNDFSLSKTAMVTQAERRNNGFRRHYSTNEYDFFRGIASTVKFGKVNVSLFYSSKRNDGTVEDSVITSLKTDGLHRLQRDLSKKQKFRISTFGGNIRYVTPGISVGLTALSYSFGKYALNQKKQPYNVFYFRGYRNLNVSVDYMLKYGAFKFYGESAFSKNGAFATLNAVSFSPVSYISFLLLYRFYDKRYQALWGNAFSQSSSVCNENGLYASIQFTPFPYWKFSLYADFFKYPWLKYGVDTPSSGQEYMFQADYTASDKWSCTFRYRFKEKEKNRREENISTNRIIPYRTQRFLARMRYVPSESVSLKSSLESVFYKEHTDGLQKGFLVSQAVSWTPLSLPFTFDLCGAWFHTDNYRCRLSSYEKNLHYMFGYSSFYGHGIRLSFIGKWMIHSGLSLAAKLSHTQYMNRDEIGSGQEMIKGSGKTDFSIQLSWNF